VDDITFHEVQLFNHLVEIIIYLSRTHQFRSRFYIFAENLASRIAQLLTAPQKHLRLSKTLLKRLSNNILITRPAALKFFRSCIGLPDEHYSNQFIKQGHFGPILNIVYETMPRDNLLNSACLELFEFIKRENLKPLIEHLVTTYRSRLQEITYVDTFQNLILRYEQMNHNPDADMTLFSNDGTTTPNRSPNLTGNRWQGVREMDAAEQAYFDTSDDEDDSPATKKLKTSSAPMTNVLAPSPTILKSLVDYPDDDEDSMDALAMDHIDTKPPPKLAPSPMLQTPPPERLSEKRRREEDNDEDELGKLSSSTKRRNSGPSPSSIGSNSPAANSTLRRKKNFISKDQRDSPTAAGAGEKMNIEISLASKAPVTEPGGEQG